MQVLKFGGTSVGSVSAIRQIRSILEERVKQDQLWVVVSAFGGTTDLLLKSGQLAAAGEEEYKEFLGQMEKRHLEAVKELLPLQAQSGVLSQVKTLCNEIEDICSGIFLLGEMTARSYDKLLSYGELLSSVIIAAAFKAHGMECAWKDTRELILTDSRFGQAAVDMHVTNEKIQAFQKETSSRLIIFPGFIARNEQGVTTTLGRGGSDYTAALLAAAAGASLLDIWTDVSGMMTADPRWVPNARIIPSISYHEAMELSHFGAKVIYPPTIQPVLAKKIPIRIKNTFSPNDPGTMISDEPEKNGSMIRGISSINHIALLSLEGSGMIGVPGFAKRLFEALSSAGVNVILITQGSSEHSICVGVDAANAELARTAVDTAFAAEIAFKKVDPLVVEKDLSIVALVGEQMKSHTGISGKMFGVMGRNGVNVRAIAQGSSEKNISAVVSTPDVRKAINVLHEEFFEKVNKQVNLFICGVGNVGSKLLMQLDQQRQFLSEQLRLQVRIVGLANSKQFVFSDEGVDPGKWKESLEKGEKGGIDDFVKAIIQRNLRNSVFVDVTASDAVAGVYQQLLEKSISVVACNKIACSSVYSHYRKLKDLAREFNASFLFETNVGAGLPVIGTLNDLLRSGDKVNRMEAVLSGTLNFVFNNYNATRPFAEVVKQAQEEGYTEPDPRLDLGGTDVMRKIMILARESGQPLEMEQIANRSFMPASCMQGTVADFYNEMAKEENHFKKLYEEAAAKGMKLKFVAKYENGKAEVGLQHIDPQHDLYHLYGKDNVVLFYTDRYREQPMVIKGAGAGAEVTASGVFADVMRAARM
ncbi:MAG: bifunctional aspartate kinase/homoserine dehydrogenase I [Chitinophagales bacterium]|nr:bifunctional aspartate kinase/homoserine dehydrogenase I [Chitinophagales bacterium]